MVAAVRDYSAELPVLGLPGSAFLRAAEKAGLRTVREFFVDRGYTPEGALVPRSRAGCRAARSGRGHGARAPARRQGRGGVGRRRRRRRPGRVRVRPRRLAGRGRDGARGAGRARRGRSHACGRSHEGAAVRRRRAARRGRRADGGAGAGRGGAHRAAGRGARRGARSPDRAAHGRAGHGPRRAAPDASWTCPSTRHRCRRGGAGRDPGDLRRPGPRRGRPADRAGRVGGRRRAHRHPVADRVRRVRPGLRLPHRRGRAAAGAAPRRAAHHGAGRRRRAGRGVQRRLPAAVAGGLAAHRLDRRRGCGIRTATRPRCSSPAAGCGSSWRARHEPRAGGAGRRPVGPRAGPRTARASGRPGSGGPGRPTAPR